MVWKNVLRKRTAERSHAPGSETEWPSADPAKDEIAGEKPPFQKQDFGTGFSWGVATAAFQTEGAWKKHGKGRSIWDKFTHRRGTIKTGENANVAADFYNRYREDIDLLGKMEFDSFRFSISWPRVLPKGKGKANKRGLDFYDKVIDYCLKKGITPWVTLYHWDLPHKLQKRGGWTNRDVTGWFSDYADLATKRYGDRVKNWMVLNEPMAFTGLGYLTGYHAPGQKSLSSFLSAVHHTALCQAAGGRIVRSNVPEANVGTTFSCSHVDPVNKLPWNVDAAKKMDAVLNRLFVEPALGMGYPTGTVPLLKQIEKYMLPGDEALLPFDFDFIGIQNYFRVVSRFSLFTLGLFATEVPAEKRNVEMNSLNFEIFPEGIYHMLRRFGGYEGVKNVVVTENGVCLPDKLVRGRVHDPRRIRFFEEYLLQVLRAKKEGVNVSGYFVWTLTDNFEWSEGYDPRFGLVYVDFKNQRRYVKDSGRWWREFLK